MASRFDHDLTGFDHPSMNYKPPKELRRFRAGLTLLVAVLIVTGVWTLYWLILAKTAQDSVRTWVADQQAAGAEASFKGLDVSGFPGRIEMTLDQPRWSGPLGGQAVAWQGERLSLTLKPWSPFTVHMDAVGRHTINLDSESYRGSVAGAHATFSLGGAWPESLEIDISGLELGNGERIAAERLRAVVRQPTTDGVTLEIDASGVVMPRHLSPPLGQNLSRLDVAVDIIGPIAPGPTLKSVLTPWQAAGGVAHVRRLNFDYESLSVSAGGRGGLDPDMQPAFELTAKIKGVFGTLDRFRALGLVRDSDVVMAKMVLSAFVRKDPNGGPSTLNAQVSLKGGVLSLGGVPVAKLAPLVWPN